MKLKAILTAFTLVVVLGAGLIIYNVLGTRVEPEEAPGIIRYKAPDFTAYDFDGNEVRLSGLLGTPVVLNFWASWCPPCKNEMPDFQNAFDEYGDKVHFFMLNAIGTYGETREIAFAYIEENGFTFPVYYDMAQDGLAAYGIRAFPTSIFIDGEGYMVAAVEGQISEAALRRGIGLITG